MNITVNALLEYQTENQFIHERILWLDPNSDVVVTLNCTAKQALPILKPLNVMQEELRLGTVRLLTVDPYVRVIDFEQLNARGQASLKKACQLTISAAVLGWPWSW